MSKTEAAFPGFDSPGVGFEQPFEMLEACHERVQRSLDLLGRLVAHVDRNGHDGQSRSAATDVLRYFDIAAPLHHADEETHVFPLLLAQGDASMCATVGRLRDDHRQMEQLWATVRSLLLRWREAGAQTDANSTPDDNTRLAIERFRSIYADHIAAEEGLVFPAARMQMDGGMLADMGRQMQMRRQA